MGTKGAKLTGVSTTACEEFVSRISPFGDVSFKRMFGGYGVFEAGKMFALVNSNGDVFLKVSDLNRKRFTDAGSKPHGKMPYFQIPASVMEDDDILFEWTKVSIGISKDAVKK